MSAEGRAEPLARAWLGVDLINPSALAAIAMWSATAPIAKYALDEFHVLAYTVLRPIVAVILLFGLLAYKREPILMPAADIKRVAFVGVFGLGMSQLCYIGALDNSSVAHTVILASISPLIVAAYALAVKRQRLPGRSLLGIGGGFLGVVLLVAGAGGAGDTSLFGDALALISAIAWMGVTIWPKSIFARHGTIRPMAWMFLSSLIPIFPISALPLVDTIDDPPSALAWGSLAYSAVFGALVGNGLWQRAVQQLGANRTLIYLYLQPVGAMILAALWLGERLSPIQAVGGLLALAGVGLVRRD